MDLTTAQRLAAYRAELIVAGFEPVEAQRLVEKVAPSLIEDLDLKAARETSASAPAEPAG
jgi:hypothetical protein